MCPTYHIPRRPSIPSQRDFVDDADPSWMLNTSTPAKEHCERVRVALVHQLELQNILSSLLAPGGGGVPVGSSIASPLRDAQKELDGLHGFFSAFLNPAFYNERIPPSGDGISTAERVFSVAELLEMILGYVAIRDIMSFQQVNHAAYDAIENSPKLQRSLSLRADLQSTHLKTPFGEYTHCAKGGFYCGYQSPEAELNAANAHQLPITAGFSKCATEFSWEIGNRWRRMFICQPPVHEMKFTTNCCGPWDDNSVGNTMRSDTGFTIGDLYDATKSLVLEHRTCVNASIDHLDEDGFVRVSPTFSAKVMLNETDPIYQERSRICVRRSRSMSFSPYRLRRDRLQAYVNYKRNAHANDEPLLSLSELEATRWSDDAVIDEHGMRDNSAIATWQVESTMKHGPQPTVAMRPPPPLPPST